MPDDHAPSGTAGVRILVVEDDAHIASPLKSLLDHYGYDARVAATVAAALREFDLWLPHAVLLDLKLTDGNGATVFQHIRMRAPTTAVAVLSGAARDPRIISGLAPLKPDRVFTKPTEFFEIRQWLDSTRPKSPPKPRQGHQ